MAELASPILVGQCARNMRAYDERDREGESERERDRERERARARVRATARATAREREHERSESKSDSECDSESDSEREREREKRGERERGTQTQQEAKYKHVRSAAGWLDHARNTGFIDTGSSVTHGTRSMLTPGFAFICAHFHISLLACLPNCLQVYVLACENLLTCHVRM